MAAEITRLRTNTDRTKEEMGKQLRYLLLNFDGLPTQVVQQLVHAIDHETDPNDSWPFLMISADQFVAVTDWLSENSNRARIALRLWSRLLTAVDHKTGEILLTRQELAERVKTTPNAITDCLSELASIGAVTRRRERIPGTSGPGRTIVYLNSRVGTHLPRATRSLRQAEENPLNIPVPITNPRKSTTPPKLRQVRP